jgi:hypothetical protein
MSQLLASISELRSSISDLRGCDLDWWSERGSASRSNARNWTVSGNFEDEDENEDEDERLTTGLNHARSPIGA